MTMILARPVHPLDTFKWQLTCRKEQPMGLFRPDGMTGETAEAVEAVIRASSLLKANSVRSKCVSRAQKRSA
jgi:hypothetical protein